MTLDLARKAAQALVEALSDPAPSDPPASLESTPSTLTPSTQEALIDRLLTEMSAMQTRWMEAMITMAHGRESSGRSPASTWTPTADGLSPDLQPGPATGPGQQGLSMSSYDDDRIPLAPGIDAILAREAEEDDRQRVLRTQPDVLEFQLEERRRAMGLSPMGPAPPDGSPS